ncbi:murein biosynthesis integral membrane protein MurJ [Hahella sp. CCB-MM4]|uniref:murein biosynthesis integral membrane protein MurJ n=1 Tax=Hahella sp. (strain CCB-MM4) TaxID=1926491 RepID=UPI000B9A8F06|nr:murein biosynthesis integral membrane protein MurJ [Hahella sp. CCB-MM4]OZG71467.1 murein biosynthesis integral membrane protein MurJ [Hahella sp. CCB-MM4]
MSVDTPEKQQTADIKPGSLLRSSGLVGVMTMLSRVLGLIRDIVIANFFGAGAGADAFFVAFKIPNFMRRLFAEGAFSQAFVPVLSEYRATAAPADIRILVNSVAGTLGVVLCVMTAVAVLAAPVLTALFAPGFLDEEVKFGLAVDMLRITFPYLFLISMTAFAGAVLNSYGNFAVPAFTPVLLNLSLIGSVYFITPFLDENVMALAWGVMIAGFAQLIFQMPFLARLNLLPKPRVDRHHEGVKRILKLMTPALFGVSVSQVNLLLDTVLASFLVTGSVSWLYYSDRLSELPLGVFGIAIATVILPSLSRKHATANSTEFSATLDWAMRAVMLIGVPAALALAILAVPLISTLFQRGAIVDNDVLMSAKSLRAYAAGLLFFMLIKVLATGYFSRQDTKTPVKVGVIAMVSNMVLNLMLILPLAHAGLALATSLSAALNAGLLWRGLLRQGVYTVQAGWWRFVGQLGVASLSMVGFLIWLNPSDQFWLSADIWQKIAWISGLCIGGAATYFILLFIVGVRVRHFKMQD